MGLEPRRGVTLPEQPWDGTVAPPAERNSDLWRGRHLLNLLEGPNLLGGWHHHLSGNKQRDLSLLRRQEKGRAGRVSGRQGAGPADSLGEEGVLL